MKEFIDKLISRLEENRRLIVMNDEDLEWNRAVYSCTETVNQLAEEYNNKSVKGDLISRSLLLKAIDKCLEDCENHMTEPSIWNVIGIIKRQPTVCNDGWIPCSVDLPKIPNSYLVTKMCENDGNPIYETAHEIFWTSDKKWDCERDEYCEWKVIAWQNKLVPYQPKGE